MTVYDSNQSPEYQPPSPYVPPTTPLGHPDAQPTTGADRWALVALTISLMAVLSCVPGANCVALFAPLVAGGIALSQAKNAADPQRARTYGIIAVVIGALILVGIIVISILYGALILSAFEQASNSDL